MRDVTSTAPSRRRQLSAFGVICLAELLIVLDMTIINVALPSIGVELSAGISGLQWVVDAYTLTFSGLLLAFGNLGDRYGLPVLSPPIPRTVRFAEASASGSTVLTGRKNKGAEAYRELAEQLVGYWWGGKELATYAVHHTA